MTAGPGPPLTPPPTLVSRDLVESPACQARHNKLLYPATLGSYLTVLDLTCACVPLYCADRLTPGVISLTRVSGGRPQQVFMFLCFMRFWFLNVYVWLLMFISNVRFGFGCPMSQCLCMKGAVYIKYDELYSLTDLYTLIVFCLYMFK